MSKKRTKYTAEFKTKIVLKVLQNDQTLNQIATTHNITPKNIQNWKKIFLSNAELAMEPAKAVKEYKDEIVLLKVQNDQYAKTVGKLTVEKEWAVRSAGETHVCRSAAFALKLKCLDLSSKQQLVDVDNTKPNTKIKRLSLIIPFSRSNDMNIVPIIVLPMFIKNLSHSTSSNGDFL